MSNRSYNYTSAKPGTGLFGSSADIRAEFTTIQTGFTEIEGEIDLKAPLSSPALTDIPTAPTAAANTNTTQIATTAFVVGQASDDNPIVNGSVSAGVSKYYSRKDHVHPTDTSRLSTTDAASTYAPLISPALAGNPTAPTAAAGNNGTSIATTAFVQGAITGLVNSAPGTMDTLKEISDALGADPNFATTMTTALGAKAPLSSPALTDIPTAPTAAANTNTTQIATTAFVVGQASAAVPLPSSATAGVIGVSKKYSRDDHVHQESGAAIAAAETATTKAGEASTSADNAAISEGVATAMATALTGTSTTTLTPSTAEKVVTTQAGKSFTAGSFVQLVSASNSAVWMFGPVTSYTGTTLTFTPSAIGTATEKSDWVLLGRVGARGVEGMGVTAQTVGFTLSGGTTSKTLTVTGDATIAGTPASLGPNTFTGVQTVPANGLEITGSSTGKTILASAIADSTDHTVTFPDVAGTVAILASSITDGDTTHAPDGNSVYDALALKQATLVSGTNVKTVNSTSLLGSGNLAVASLAANTFTDTQNLSDNILQRPVIKDYGETINAIGGTGGGTQDIDLTLGNVVTATVDTSANTFTFSNPSASGVACSFTLILTNGGSQTVNWPASVDWPAGTAPTLTASGVDVLAFITTDAGTTWRGFAQLDVK